MTVPGVSGGTMAMVLGIYDRLISSVSRVFKEPKQSIPFLLWFALGGAGGILLFSRGISLLLSSRWEVPARFFFLGAVGGGIPLIFKEAGIKRFGSGDAVFVGIGILSALLIGDPGRPVHAGSRRGIRYSHTGFRRSYHRSGPGPSPGISALPDALYAGNL